MQKFISIIDESSISYFDDDVVAGDWIDLSKYRLMTDEEISKHEAIRLSKFHDHWDGFAWVDQRTEQEILAAKMKDAPALTRRQFRMILVLNGYDLDEIKTQILAIEDIQTRQLTLIEWEDANTFERTSPSLVMMAGLLQLNEDQVNAMWEQALTL